MPFNPDDPEFRASRKAPTLFSNRAYITVKDGMFRIAFGEAPMDVDESNYHSAVLLSIGDALDIAASIQALYRELYPQQPPPTPGVLGDAPRNYPPRKPPGG
jgi:hypothetical protein